jgi:hypothetical protein
MSTGEEGTELRCYSDSIIIIVTEIPGSLICSLTVYTYLHILFVSLLNDTLSNFIIMEFKIGYKSLTRGDKSGEIW